MCRQDKGGLSIFPCLGAIYEDVVMNCALSYTHVNLEKLTPVNFFQDYCDMNEIKVWPSMVGERKERKTHSSLFVFALCMGWAGIVWGPAGAAEKPICLTPMQHKRDICTSEGAGHLAARQKS